MQLQEHKQVEKQEDCQDIVELLQKQSTQIIQKVKKQERQSQELPNYLHYLFGESRSSFKLQRDRDWLMDELEESRMILKRVETYSKFTLTFIEDANLNKMSVLVSYGFFNIVIAILIIDEESPAHKCSESKSGNEGTTYRANILYKETAIKCHTYDENTFNFQLTLTIKEYVLMHIASILQAGPYIYEGCGWDIIIYRNCIEFCMEYCQHNPHLSPAVQSDLKVSLKRLHTLGIVHFDIKPDNICYSPTYRKTVFIDFGMAEIIKQEIGNKSYRSYCGTLSFSSQQMRQLLIKGPNFIDVYQNDALCLRNSLVVIKDNLYLQPEKISPDNLSYFYFNSLLKFIIFKDTEKNMHFILTFFNKFRAFLKNGIFKQTLYEELNTKPYPFYFQNMIKKILIHNEQPFLFTESIEKFKNCFNKQKPKIESEKTFLMEKNERIKKQCLIDPKIERNSKTKFNKKNLNKKQMILKIDAEEYLLLLAQHIRVDSIKANYHEKIDYCRLYLQQFAQTEFESEKCVQQAIRYLFMYCFKAKISSNHAKIALELLISVFIFQLFSQKELLLLLTKVLQSSLILQLKEEMCLRFLIAVHWIRYKLKSSYSFERLELQILQVIDKFRSNLNKLRKFGNISRLIQHRFIGYKSIVPTAKIGNFKHSYAGEMSDSELRFYVNSKAIHESLFEHECFDIYLFDLSVRKYRRELAYFTCGILEKRAIQKLYYQEDIFFFQLFPVYSMYIQIGFQQKIENLFRAYEQVFRYYSFFKDFKIYHDYHLYHLEQDQNHQMYEIIRQIAQLAKDNFSQQGILLKLKILKIIERKNNESSLQIVQILSFSTQKLKKLLDEIINTSKNEIKKFHEHDISNKIETLMNLAVKISLLYSYSNNKSSSSVNFDDINEKINALNDKIQEIDCFECKQLIYLSIMPFKCLQNSIKIKQEDKNKFLIQILVFSLRNNVVMNIEALCMEMNIVNSLDSNILYVCYHMISASRKFYLFYEALSLNLSKIYMQFFERSQLEELVEFIKMLTFVLKESQSLRLIRIFCRQMEQIITTVKKKYSFQDQRNFFEIHIIYILLLQRNSVNPYIAFWYINILRLRKNKLDQIYIYYFLAKALPIINYKPREYIQKIYYSDIIRNHSNKIKKRQFYYLSKLNFKYNTNYFQIKTILNVKKSKISSKVRGHLAQIDSILTTKIINYHSNIGNIQYQSQKEGQTNK